MKATQNRLLLLAVSLLLSTAITSCYGIPAYLDKNVFASKTAFRLEFPEDVSLGALRIEEDGNCFTCGSGEEDLGQAIGTHEIQLHSSWYISLSMPAQASHLMRHLSAPSLADIGHLQLKGSDITDEDLQHIAELNLRSIDLGNTKITGAGLKYLKPNKDWISVNLSGCENLEPEHLASFKGWERATLTVTSNGSWDLDNYSEADLKLVNDARRVICEGQPCRIQIF